MLPQCGETIHTFMGSRLGCMWAALKLLFTWIRTFHLSCHCQTKLLQMFLFLWEGSCGGSTPLGEMERDRMRDLQRWRETQETCRNLRARAERDRWRKKVMPALLCGQTDAHRGWGPDKIAIRLQVTQNKDTNKQSTQVQECPLTHPPPHTHNQTIFQLWTKEAFVAHLPHLRLSSIVSINATL